VDDDAAFRDSTRRLLWIISKSMPTRVFEASSGEEALNTVKRESIDCVLLDHGMPGGTGVEWIEKLIQAREHLAVVMLTGEGDEQTAVEAMKSGALDYLMKGSVTAASLQRAVSNAIEKVELRKTIETQRETLLTAERLRVMVESLGSVCHHLGQPMTVIGTYVDIMKRQEVNPELREMIQQCGEAVDEANAFLTQLQATCFYRTEPYLEVEAAGDRILAIGSEAADAQ